MTSHVQPEDNTVTRHKSRSSGPRVRGGKTKKWPLRVLELVPFRQIVRKWTPADIVATQGLLAPNLAERSSHRHGASKSAPFWYSRAASAPKRRVPSSLGPAAKFGGRVHA